MPRPWPKAAPKIMVQKPFENLQKRFLGTKAAGRKLPVSLAPGVSSPSFRKDWQQCAADDAADATSNMWETGDDKWKDGFTARTTEASTSDHADQWQWQPGSSRSEGDQWESGSDNQWRQDKWQAGSANDQQGHHGDDWKAGSGSDQWRQAGSGSDHWEAGSDDRWRQDKWQAGLAKDQQGQPDHGDVWKAGAHDGGNSEKSPKKLSESEVDEEAAPQARELREAAASAKAAAQAADKVLVAAAKAAEEAAEKAKVAAEKQQQEEETHHRALRDAAVSDAKKAQTVVDHARREVRRAEIALKLSETAVDKALKTEQHAAINLEQTLKRLHEVGAVEDGGLEDASSVGDQDSGKSRKTAKSTFGTHLERFPPPPPGTVPKKELQPEMPGAYGQPLAEPCQQQDHCKGCSRPPTSDPLVDSTFQFCCGCCRLWCLKPGTRTMDAMNLRHGDSCTGCLWDGKKRCGKIEWKKRCDKKSETDYSDCFNLD